MSFSFGVIGKKDELEGLVSDKFHEIYEEPAPGVEALVNVATGAVTNFREESSEDDGLFSVSISGHAKQGDSDRDSLTISISPTT